MRAKWWSDGERRRGAQRSRQQRGECHGFVPARQAQIASFRFDFLCLPVALLYPSFDKGILRFDWSCFDCDQGFFCFESFDFFCFDFDLSACQMVVSLRMLQGSTEVMTAKRRGSRNGFCKAGTDCQFFLRLSLLVLRIALPVLLCSLFL